MAKLRGGIDLGGTKIQTVVVDGRNHVRGQAKQETPRDGGGPAAISAAMAAALQEAATAAGAESGDLEGVGVGSPGDVDEKAGTVSSARNLEGWEGSYPLAQELSEKLGTRVVVGNDVQVAVQGEYHLGAGKPFGSVLGVWWGTGVGGGLILDGKPWLGRGAAGEIGHTVVKRGGAKCPCGRKGCLEAYAGRAAMEEKARRAHANGKKTDLFKLMRNHNRDRLTSGIWERALEHDDKLAGKLLDRAVKMLGTGIASAVNLLDIEAVVLGGGLGTRFGERYKDDLKQEMHKHLFVDERPPTLEVAELGDLGGAIGAALLAA